MQTIFQNQRIPGMRTRWQLGHWLTYRKLSTAAYLPGQRDRLKLNGKQPHWYTFDFPNLGARLNAEQRVSMTDDFVIMAIVATGTAAGGFSLSFYDAGRDERFSYVMEGSRSTVGSAKHPFFLRHPYCVTPKTPILIRVQNSDINSANSIQVALHGVTEA
jgi:hypothetical protein